MKEYEDRDKLMRVLEDYYGDSRDLDFKEGVADFIECCFEEIIEIMSDEDN